MDRVYVLPNEDGPGRPEAAGFDEHDVDVISGGNLSKDILNFEMHLLADQKKRRIRVAHGQFPDSATVELRLGQPGPTLLTDPGA